MKEHEKEYLLERPEPWRYEGVAWYSPSRAIADTYPIERFCNLQTGGYLYTISESEKEYLLARPATWRYEGVAWYAYPDQIDNTKPVYRFCNLESGVYLFTASESEKEYLLARPETWRDEGIGWYVATDNMTSKSMFSLSTPICSFNATPTIGTAPFTVNFVDNSSGEITKWEWDFGDNSFSILKNPSHTFNSEGSYSIILTVEGPQGVQSIKRDNYITVNSPELDEAITALKVVAGMNPSGVSVNGDEKIGLERAIFILQTIAGVRE